MKNNARNVCKFRMYRPPHRRHACSLTQARMYESAFRVVDSATRFVTAVRYGGGQAAAYNTSCSKKQTWPGSARIFPEPILSQQVHQNLSLWPRPGFNKIVAHLPRHQDQNVRLHESFVMCRMTSVITKTSPMQEYWKNSSDKANGCKMHNVCDYLL